MTTIRLAQAGTFNGIVSGCSEITKPPAFLVSYYYLHIFNKLRHLIHIRDWAMDSGAFSAHNSGITIHLQKYIDCCKQLLATDPKLTEIFALDVIGDWEASLRNTEEMWRQGVPAIPCYHGGEPWDALVTMAHDYPKIALGGVALKRGHAKLRWAEECFSRVWPKKIHGFAFGSEKAILSLPFHSVDASSWAVGPCCFGRWSRAGKLSIKGSYQPLRFEVEWWLELEARAKRRWEKTLKELENDENSNLCPSAT